MPQQPLGDVFDGFRLAPEDDDFEAVVAVHVDVKVRDDLGGVFVLNVHESVGQITVVVFVDQSEHSDLGGFIVRPALLHQFRPDEVSNRFGSAGITSLADEGVELLKQRTVH